MFDKMLNIFFIDQLDREGSSSVVTTWSMHVCDRDLLKVRTLFGLRWQPTGGIRNIEVVTTWWLLVQNTSQSKVGMLPGLR